MAGPVSVLAEIDEAATAGEPAAEPTPPRRPMDEELKAIAAMLRILEDMGPGGAQRTLLYLADRYRSDHAT